MLFRGVMTPSLMPDAWHMLDPSSMSVVSSCCLSPKESTVEPPTHQRNHSKQTHEAAARFSDDALRLSEPHLSFQQRCRPTSFKVARYLSLPCVFIETAWSEALEGRPRSRTCRHLSGNSPECAEGITKCDISQSQIMSTKRHQTIT